MASYIYVLSNGDVSKIGITTHPYRRLSSIKSSTGENYVPIKLWECPEASVDSFERELIERLSGHIIKGREWFGIPSSTAVDAVVDVSNKYPVLRPIKWPESPPSGQQTIYLPDDVAAELEAIRATRRPIPSMNAIINEMVWEGLPTDAKINITRKGKADA